MAVPALVFVGMFAGCAACPPGGVPAIAVLLADAGSGAPVLDATIEVRSSAQRPGDPPIVLRFNSVQDGAAQYFSDPFVPLSGSSRITARAPGYQETMVDATVDPGACSQRTTTVRIRLTRL